MKEQLYTIPLVDVLKAGDECPFCCVERKLEQEALDFVLGASYMESDIREETDKAGFCRRHYKMMFDYGNSLGNAWILSTRLKYMNSRMKELMDGYGPEKSSLFGRMKKGKGEESRPPLIKWLKEEEGHCYFCSRVNTTYERYLDTFFYLFKKDREFVSLVEKSKGFCFHHFGELMEASQTRLNAGEQEEFCSLVFGLMKENMDRVQEDINWFIEKYDYRNQDADWKNSKDAIQRTMQKMAGGYPADPVYKNKK